MGARVAVSGLQGGQQRPHARGPHLQAPPLCLQLLALYLVGHQAGQDCHEPGVALLQSRLGGVAQAAQGAVDAPIREPQGQPDVGAYAGLAGDLEAADAPVAPGVGYHVGEGALHDPLAEGVLKRHLAAFLPAEGLRVALQGAELHTVLGEPRDEGDVHAQGLPGQPQRALGGVEGAAGCEVGEPLQPAGLGRSVGPLVRGEGRCAVAIGVHGLLLRWPGHPYRAEVRRLCGPASRRASPSRGSVVIYLEPSHHERATISVNAPYRCP